jgi:Na+-driven multidrug efflux pump
MLNPFLKNVMGIENHEAIKAILVTLIPFYLAYNYTVLFDNLLIGYGKTQYCFVISMIVNLIYYPAVYGLVLKGVFTPDIKFICRMFGFGMVVHLGCSVACFLIYNRSTFSRQKHGGRNLWSSSK